MKIHWKSCRLAACAALLTLAAGCSGINASHSISPATFLLPGLLKAEPQRPAEPAPAILDTPDAGAVRQFAQAR
ncbi:MAG: hypothetical protein KJ070_05410 [Verrucomicrobia bacterium]|nr:hypothetical protein [Verrucomicrobiota bacterium]